MDSLKWHEVTLIRPSLAIWGRGSGIGSEWTRRSGRDFIPGSRPGLGPKRSGHSSARFKGEIATLSAYPVFFRKRKTFFLNKFEK